MNSYRLHKGAMDQLKGLLCAEFSQSPLCVPGTGRGERREPPGIAAAAAVFKAHIRLVLESPKVCLGVWTGGSHPSLPSGYPWVFLGSGGGKVQ